MNKFTVEPWNNHGIGDQGAYIRVRGNQIGKQFKIANVPFTVDKDGKFWDVKGANEIAEMIRYTPTMYKLMEAIAKNYTGIDIIEEAKEIVTRFEEFKTKNK